MKIQLVKAGLALLSAIGADRWLGRSADWAGTALMFHRVRPKNPDRFQPNAHLEITPEFLEEIVLRLRDLGIAIVSLDEAAERLARAEKGTKERFAVLTFDDGYADNFEHALPVLKRHNAPFTIFVAPGMIDGTSSAWWMVLEEILRRRDQMKLLLNGRQREWTLTTPLAKLRAFYTLSDYFWTLTEHERDEVIRDMAERTGVSITGLLADNMMTWDQVRAISREPLVNLGSHTVNHLALARLDDDEARQEILGGIARMTEMLGTIPRHFAYPYGSAHEVSARDHKLVQEIGISVALTTRRGMLPAGRSLNPADWPRLSMNGNFQSRRYLDILLSGVPFMLDGWRPRRQRLAPAKPAGLTARPSILRD